MNYMNFQICGVKNGGGQHFAKLKGGPDYDNPRYLYAIYAFLLCCRAKDVQTRKRYVELVENVRDNNGDVK